MLEVLALQLWALAIVGLVGTSMAQQFQKLHFFCSEKELNYTAINKAVGMVYLGAVNMFYQLSTSEVPHGGHLCSAYLLDHVYALLPGMYFLPSFLLNSKRPQGSSELRQRTLHLLLSTQLLL